MAAWPPDGGTAFADAGGVTLAYESFGRESDPAVLLIMGLGSQMVVWDEGFCRMLAGRGLRVIRFDNRDIGLSARFDHLGVPDFSAGIPAAVPYTLADMAGDLVGLMDALRIGSAHLVGLSMGGMIGQEAACRYPDRVLTLVSLMSSTGNPGLPPPTPAAAEILMTPFPTDRSGFVESFVNAYRVLCGGGIPMDPELSRKWAEASYRRGLNPAGVARQYAAIAAAGDRRRSLAAMRTPTLVVHGDHDPLLPLDCGEDTANTIPGARLEIIPRMGHCLPEAVWPRLAGLIADHIAASKTRA